MPTVDVSVALDAPMSRVWDVVTDIESYPQRMETVRSVRIVDDLGNGERRSAWSVLLRGSILEWTQREWLHPEQYTVRFVQDSGDLDRFDGAWILRPHGGGTRASLVVEFEIGIPLLAAMLEPIAEEALRDNARAMLLALDGLPA